jgi:hypothetical protein
MSARAFETFLARIYVDARARARFKANPCVEAQRAGLSGEECKALETMDWLGLEMAARSFAHKRKLKIKQKFASPALARTRRFFASLWQRVRSAL